MALNLTERMPTSVECIKKEGASSFMFPKSSVIRFDFPAHGEMPAVKLFWHDGLKEAPKIPGVPDGEFLGDLPNFGRPRVAVPGGTPAPPNQAPAQRLPAPPSQIIGKVFDYEAYKSRAAEGEPRPASPNGSLFIGDKGMLTTGTYGEETRLLPLEKMKDYKFPAELLTRSPGHYRDWIRACKGGDPACSNFNVAVPFVSWMLLGVISLRVDGKLEWDAEKGVFSNNKDANKYLKPPFKVG